MSENASSSDSPISSDREAELIRNQPRSVGPRGGGPMGSGTGMPAEKSKNFAPSARRLVRRLQPERTAVIAVIAVGVLSVALSVVVPAILGQATNLIWDGVRGAGIDFGAVAVVLGWALALYVASAILSWTQAYILNDVTQRTVLRLRAEAEDKLHRLPLSYFDRMPRGELLSRVTNDIDNVSQTLQQTLSQVITSVLTVVGVISMMMVISPWLTLIALVTVPLMLLVTKQVAARSQTLFIAQWDSTGRLNAQIEEDYTGHALVRIFGNRSESDRRFDAENNRLYESSFGAQFISGIIQPAMTFIGNLVYVAIAVVGGLMITSGALSLGSVQAFIQYSRQFVQPLSQLGSMANLLQSGVASAERVFELYDAPEQVPDPVEPQSPPTGTGRLAFEDVSFRYVPDKPLIEDLSLVVEPNQSIAIVGPSGAGKTTLVNLLMRFYELDGGRITLDGVDITDMTRADLRNRMGMVLQDAWIFSDTIRANILYGRPDADESEMIAAAEASYVDRFVRRLPDGYDTVVDDDAASLSAGERQLITIARATLSDPSVLILDEATSSVDTRTELLLQRAMTALRSDRTSFVIAHRLSTIRDADLILVMEDGSIVEQGTHDELVDRGGAYTRLYDAQFAGTADCAEDPALEEEDDKGARRFARR